MPKLHTLAGPVATPSLEFDGQFITIGRAQGNTLHLNHRSVSKYHALIVLEEGKALLFDLHSTNGTYVNGERVRSCALNPNDELLIGQFQFRYESEQAPAPQPLTRPSPTPRPTSLPVSPTPTPSPPTAAPIPIAPAVAQKLADSGPRSTTGSIPAQPTSAKPPSGPNFIRVSGQTLAEEKPGAVKELIARHTGRTVASTASPTPTLKPIATPSSCSTSPVTPAAEPVPGSTPAPAQPAIAPPPPPSGPEPAPTSPAPATPPTPSPDAPVVSAPTPKSDGLLVKKPAPAGERILVKPGSGTGDRVLKKPGAPKS